jgi:hypothetical protein
MTRSAAPVLGMVLAGLLLVPAVAAAATPARAAEDAALTVADLAAYRAALSPPQGTPEPPAAVDFRALWNHPATYQGRRVRVEGRLVRRFRQGSFGTFPPLEEAWVFSPQGDPFCLVFPAAADTQTKVSEPLGFTGTFLKLVEYQGGDGRRLAPLIVGPAPPVTRARDRRPSGVPPATRLDWTIGLAAALVAAFVLAYQHLRRPPGRPLELKSPIEPEPVFDDAPVTAPEPDRSESD